MEAIHQHAASPPATTTAELLAVLHALGSARDREGIGDALRQIGAAAFDRYCATTRPAQWDVLLGYAYAALTEAVAILDRRLPAARDASQTLALVRTEIGYLTGDEECVRQALALMHTVETHPTITQFPSFGLDRVQADRQWIETRLAELGELAAPIDMDRLRRLTPPSFDAAGFERWLAAQPPDPARPGQ